MRSERFASYFVLTLMMASGVVSADSYVPAAPGDVYSCSDAAGDSKGSDTDGKKRRSSGFYLLFGLGGSFSDNDLGADMKHAYSSDEPLQAYSAEQFESTYKPWLAERGYGDAKVTKSDERGDVTAFEVVGGSPRASKNKSHLGGVFGCGYGVRFGNGCYLGGEFVADVGKSDKVHLKNGNVEFSQKVSGVIPSAAVRLGYRVCDWHDAVFYVRAGGAFVSSEVEHSGRKIKMSKVVPLLGAGIDVAINDSWALRLEFEHRFEGKKSSYDVAADVPISGDPGGEDARFSRTIDLQQKTKGCVVRVGASYQFGA